MLWQRLTVLALVASGEGLMILAQIFGAKTTSLTQNFWLSLRPSTWYFWVTVIGSLLILTGYFYGITVFRNIWLVTLTSWTALVIIEVAIAWLVFRTVPQGQLLVALLLVLAGFILANLSR